MTQAWSDMDEASPEEHVADRWRAIESELLADSRNVGGTGLDAGYGALTVLGRVGFWIMSDSTLSHVIYL